MDEQQNLKENFIVEPKEEKWIVSPKKKNYTDSQAPFFQTANKAFIDNFYSMDSFFVILKSAIPSILSIMFIFIYDNLNIIFANKYLSRDSGSAVGIGGLYIDATGLILGIGLLGGIDTLCSQAYGAKSYYLMGLYVNVSRIVLIGFFIFVCLPFIVFSEYFLELINQPVEIIPLTSRYIKSMIPSIFFCFQFHISNHYLQAMNNFNPGMVITFITASLHCLWLYIFLGVCGLDIRGIGYAMGVTHVLNFIIITTYINDNNPNPESYFCWDLNSIAVKRIIDFLKMAIPSAIIFSADWLGFHVLILYSSYIDLTSLAANVSIFNFILLLFSIPSGISIATTVLVGNMIGMNKVKTAQNFSVVATIISMIAILILTILLQFFKESFPFIYTNDQEVAKIFTRVIPMLIIFGTADALQLCLSGILKGLGKQKPASLLALVILYPINIPMSITFAFSLNFGVIGLWYSQLCAVIFLDFSYLMMIFCLDWESNSMRTLVNINKFSEKFLLKSKMLELSKGKIN